MDEQYSFFPLTKALHITDLISLNRWKHSKSHFYESEKHDFWELLYVETGRVLVTSGKRQRVLEKGEIIFHQPNDFHAIHTIEGVYAQTICSAFRSNSACMDFFRHSVFVLKAHELQYLQDALNITIQEIDPVDLAEENNAELIKSLAITFQIIRSNLELLLLSLYHRGEKNALSESTYFRRNVYATNIAEEITTYLKTNLNNRLTLQELSTDLGYSISHLEKLYMLHTGKKIIDTFIEMKMEKACYLLTEEHHSVSKVASMLGYNNIPHFSRQFKARLGVSPSLYAKSQESAADIEVPEPLSD